jgi:hypothetical protein
MTDPVDRAREAAHWLMTDAGKAILAGALGGLVRWITLRNNWREGMAGLIVGAVCALYLGPLVEPILRPVIGAIAPQGDPAGFASFIVGLAGISLSGLVIDIFSRRKAGGGDGQA